MVLEGREEETMRAVVMISKGGIEWGEDSEIVGEDVESVMLMWAVGFDALESRSIERS